MVKALKEEGALSGEEEYVHSVPFSERSGERIEPLISLQWFCQMDELARPAIEAVEDGRVNIARAVEAGLPGLDAGDPPLVRFPPALVGSPDPGLVPRQQRPMWARPSRKARAGSGRGRARHLVLPRRSGPSRLSAGRTKPTG